MGDPQRGSGKITFGGPGSPHEKQQAANLARQIAGAAELELNAVSETVQSMRINEVGQTGDKNVKLFDELDIQFSGGLSLHIEADKDHPAELRFSGGPVDLSHPSDA